MAYLGVGIHENIVLNSETTKINDKGSLVIGLCSVTNPNNMFAAFDSGESIDKLENGLIQFCPSVNTFDGKAKTATQMGQELNNFKNTLVDILAVFMTTDKAKAAINTEVMFRGLGITAETQAMLPTRLVDQKFIDAVYKNICTAFINTATPFMGNNPFRVKLRRTSKAKHFATIPYKSAVPEIWIEPMDVPKTASQISWSKWELDNGMNDGTKVEADKPAEAETVAAMFAAPPVAAPIAPPGVDNAAFGNIPVSNSNAHFQQ